MHGLRVLRGFVAALLYLIVSFAFRSRSTSAHAALDWGDPSAMAVMLAAPRQIMLGVSGLVLVVLAFAGFAFAWAAGRTPRRARRAGAGVAALAVGAVLLLQARVAATPDTQSDSTAVAAVGAATPDRAQPSSDAGTTPTLVDLIALVPGAEPALDRLVRLQVAPVKLGANRVVAFVTDAGGAPVPAEEIEVRTIVVTGLEQTAEPLSVETEPAEHGRVAVDGLPFDQEGWWRLAVMLSRPNSGEIAVPFYLLLPDPNIYGPDAVPIAPSPPEAVAVYERGLKTMTALHRVRYRQTMASGIGTAAFAEHDVTDGSDGRLPALRYRAWGGVEGYVIGDRLWYRRVGELWTTAETSPIVLPSAWGDEFTGATGFRLGRTEVVAGEPCQIVTFVAPAAPQRDIAWYAWWVGLESGQVRRETMVAGSHYMLTEYRDFDGPLTIEPPSGPIATPTA